MPARPYASPPRVVEWQAIAMGSRLPRPQSWLSAIVAAGAIRIFGAWPRVRAARHDEHRDSETDRERVK